MQATGTGTMVLKAQTTVPVPMARYKSSQRTGRSGTVALLFRPSPVAGIIIFLFMVSEIKGVV